MVDGGWGKESKALFVNLKSSIKTWAERFPLERDGYLIIFPYIKEGIIYEGNCKNSNKRLSHK